MKIDSDEFKRRAQKVHGDKYCYEESNYDGYNKKTKIRCLEHGFFEQAVGDHLRGSGCYHCGRLKNDAIRRKDTTWFVMRAKEVHGEKYDYSVTHYVYSKTKLKIKCPEHGDFYQFPMNHLAGMGCKLCSNRKLSVMNSKTNEWFLEKATKVHGDRYDYSKCVYNNKKRVVEIICREHGKFMQSPLVHLRGSGCSKCNISGFDRMSDGFVYALISDCGQYIKIGVSNNYQDRMKRLSRGTPFGFSLIGLLACSGQDAADKEREILRSNESAGLSGFDGCTEWMKYSKQLMQKVVSLTL